MIEACEAPHPTDPGVRCAKYTPCYGHHSALTGEVWEGNQIPTTVARNSSATDVVKKVKPRVRTGPPSTLVRTTDPQTSWDAARSLGDLRESQRQVLGLFDMPMTDEELIETAQARSVQMSESGIRTRRSELVAYGLLCDTGGRGLTKNGRQSIRWGRTPGG